MVHYKNVILLGDLNADMCVSRNKAEEILEFCGSLSLHLLNYNPTHHTATSHTWIDLCMVNDLDCIIPSKQSSEPFLADHDLISFEYNYPAPSRKRKTIRFRNLADIDN